MTKLSYEAQAEFRRLWSRAESLTDDDTRKYFLENPDVLMAVAEGRLQSDLDKTRLPIDVPPGGGPSRTEDMGGWKALQRGIINLGLPTRTVVVDYRLTAKELLQASMILRDRVGDDADLDEISTRKRALRVGGVVARRIKRLSFRDEICLDELRAIFRLKHAETGAFQPVDPRTLLAYAARWPGDLPGDNGRRIAATATSKTMRGYGDADPRLPVPYLHRQRMVSGPYLEYAYDNLQGRVGADAFTPSWHVLVDVTPPDQLP